MTYEHFITNSYYRSLFFKKNNIFLDSANMFIQENNKKLKQQNHENKHYFITIKKNKLKFYLSFYDNKSRRRKKSSRFGGSMEASGSDFKLDFKFDADYKELEYDR